jgi:hypothetical protein
MAQLPVVEPRKGHPYYMYDSLTSQPDAIKRVIDEEFTHITNFAEKIVGATDIHIVGIGMKRKRNDNVKATTEYL